MKQYIDKAKVVAEIEREKAYTQTLGDNAINSSMQQFYDGMVECCNRLLNILKTLEVKEVDLEKEFYDFLDTLIGKDNGHLSEDELFRIAEYFFELGLKAKGGDE